MPGPARVLHLLGTGDRAGTAQARTVAALARHLDPERFAVAAGFLDGTAELAEPLERAGARIVALRLRDARDLRGLARSVRALRRLRPAIVHLHVGGRSRLFAARSAGAAVVAHLWAAHDDEGRPMAREIATFARRADAVVAASAHLAALAGVPATVIPPGVEMPPAAERARNARPVVGTVARLEPVKQLDVLIEAAALLPSVGFEIAGSGSLEAALRAHAARRGVADRVRFLGFVEDVAALHRRWDAFALPSRDEGFGLAALEAMAAGLPVVATRAGGLMEVVEDGRTGHLVPSGDAAALADRLRALLADDATRRAFGAAGRARAEGVFGAPVMAARVAEVYERLAR